MSGKSLHAPRDADTPAGADFAPVSAVEQTAQVTRGVCRGLIELGQVVLTEFTLRNGRRADVIGLDEAGNVTIVEVKVSTADFLADGKWPEYREFCDRLYFAAPQDFPHDILPDDCGLFVADAYGAAMLRDAPHHPMHASRRKTVLLRFARKAAGRLYQLSDPRPGAP
jgi:hypothetical protein